MLALPMQGMAAAGGVHCLPTHAPAGGQVVIGQAQVDDQSHAHRSHGASAQSEADAADHAEADAPQIHPASFTVKASTLGQTCSACAACCAGAVMPSAAIEVVSCPDLSSEHAATVAPEPASFVVGGPERPPRQVLA